MRYKSQVQAKLTAAENKVELVIKGLNNRTLTATDVVQRLSEVKRLLEDTDNLVEKETEGMN